MSDDDGDYASSYWRKPRSRMSDELAARIAKMVTDEGERQRKARSHMSAGYADIVRKTNERFDREAAAAEPLAKQLGLTDEAGERDQ